MYEKYPTCDAYFPIKTWKNRNDKPTKPITLS